MSPQQLTPAAAAKRWGVSRQRVMQWLADGRIPGAEPHADPFGRIAWTIPAAAKRPEPLVGGRKSLAR